jgi:hypothetical protein
MNGETDPLSVQDSPLHKIDLEVEDAAHRFTAQGAEDDHFVEAIHKLRRELAPRRFDPDPFLFQSAQLFIEFAIFG